MFSEIQDDVRHPQDQREDLPRAEEPAHHRARRRGRRTTLTWTCRTCSLVFTDTPSLFKHALREHASEATDWEISMAAQRDEAPPPGTARHDVSTRPLGSKHREGTYLYSHHEFLLPVIDLTHDGEGRDYTYNTTVRYEEEDRQLHEEEDYADDTPVCSEEEGSQLEDEGSQLYEEEGSQLEDEEDSQLEDEDSQLEEEDSQLDEEDVHSLEEEEDEEEIPLRVIHLDSSTESGLDSDYGGIDSW